MASRLKLAKLYLPPIAWMAFIFLLSSIPNLELKGEFSVFDFFLRKVAHMAEYAILFLLWNRALGNQKKAFVISLVYAIFDEAHQSFVPTRDGKLIDVFIDAIGAGIGWAIFLPNRFIGIISKKVGAGGES